MFECTGLPFRLIVVDCAMPAKYRAQIDAVIKGKPNVDVIRRDEFLDANAAKNLVIEAADTDFVCLTEMDVLVEPGWLAYLIEACEQHPADVAVPLITEREGVVHGNEKQWSIAEETSDGVTSYRLVPRDTPKENARTDGRTAVSIIEDHCMLFRRSVFDRIGLLDASLTTRFEVDVSMSLFKAGLTAVLEPRAQVYFVEPPPIEPEERDFFLFRYDKRRAKKSHKYVVDKWNLPELATTKRFFNRRLRVLRDLE